MENLKYLDVTNTGRCQANSSEFLLCSSTSMTSFAGFWQEETREPGPRERCFVESSTNLNSYNVEGENAKRWTVCVVVRYTNGSRRSARSEFASGSQESRRAVTLAVPSQRVYIPTSCIQIMWFVGDPGLLKVSKSVEQGEDHRVLYRRSLGRRVSRSIALNRTPKRERETRKFFDPGRVYADLISTWVRSTKFSVPSNLSV